ncbi:uncharacterized protein METZ01_LOCUS368055, partial [marine metagenome]
RMGNDYYVHKSAEDAVIKEMGLPNFRQAKNKLPSDFEYDIVHYNSKTGAVEFIQSPDWNTATEPVRGEAYRVLGKGDAIPVLPLERTQIYHHKWSFVRSDYTGFDVEASADRSVAIGEILPALKKKDANITSRYGYLDVWQGTVLPVLEPGKRITDVMYSLVGDIIPPIDPMGEVDQKDVRTLFTSPLTPVQKSYIPLIKENFPPLARIWRYLTGSEQQQIISNKGLVTKKDKKGKLRVGWMDKVIATLEHIPSDKEYAAVAFAGRAKKGWYSNSAKALIEIFGIRDAPRFAALLAALSPQVSVEQ